MLLITIGYLVTMGAQMGINYIDKNVPKTVKEPVAADFLRQESSVLEALRQRVRLCDPFD